MKKKILFVSRDMRSSGVQSSLLNLLEKLSEMEDLDITVLLEEKKGDYITNIPPSIKINEISFKKKYYNYYLTFDEAKSILSKKDYFKFILFKLFRKTLIKLKMRRLFEFILIRKISKDKMKYDLIIDFHGYGYYVSKYIAKYLDSDKKIMYIHDEKIDWFKNIRKYMKYFDNYCCVSKYVKEKFDYNFSHFSDKSIVIYNIIDTKKILQLSMEECELKSNDSQKVILSIGRIEYQKGYDLALDIATKLKKDNINYIWYIIGDGTLRENIQNEIFKRSLENNVKLLGVKKNPYPYLRKADIYVQTSRHEGFGIAITEAKILNKIIVATNLGPIAEQIINNKTGFLCNFDSDEFKEKIEKIIFDETYTNEIEKNLKKFKYDNNKEINKILSMIKDR